MEKKRQKNSYLAFEKTFRRYYWNDSNVERLALLAAHSYLSDNNNWVRQIAKVLSSFCALSIRNPFQMNEWIFFYLNFFQKLFKYFQRVSEYLWKFKFWWVVTFAWNVCPRARTLLELRSLRSTKIQFNNCSITTANNVLAFLFKSVWNVCFFLFLFSIVFLLF